MDLPPVYTSLPYSKPPGYAELPAANEHVLQSSSSDIPEPVATEYIYSSGRLVLNLGPKLWNTAVPSYGRNTAVEGYVKVKKLSHISKVVVSLYCDVYASQTRAGTTSAQMSKSFLLASTILYTENSPSREAPAKYSFSLPFPEILKGRGDNLPPSFTAVLPNAYADVLYMVKVDLIKSGLRLNEHIKTAILYLPKTRPPTLGYPFMPEASDNKIADPDEVCSNLSWQRYDIPPIARGGNDATFPLDLIIHISIPTPTIFPIASQIPYQITFSPTSPIFAFVHSSLQIQLIKRVLLKMGGNSAHRDYLVGSGEIVRVDRREDGEGVVRGTLAAGKADSGGSWDLTGCIEVRYFIKLSIKPPAQSLPMYEYTQDVHLTTHDWVERDELDRPALDMVVPHSNLSTTRDTLTYI